MDSLLMYDRNIHNIFNCICPIQKNVTMKPLVEKLLVKQFTTNSSRYVRLQGDIITSQGIFINFDLD